MVVPDASVVGVSFVKQYFLKMLSQSQELHRFYKDASTFTHIDGAVNVSVVGAQAIQAKIESLDFGNCKVDLGNGSVDAQASLDGGVLVLVSGLIITPASPAPKRFVQSFFLAPQDHNGYYVLNSLFRTVPATAAITSTATPPPTTEYAATATATAITTDKPATPPTTTTSARGLPASSSTSSALLGAAPHKVTRVPTPAVISSPVVDAMAAPAQPQQQPLATQAPPPQQLPPQSHIPPQQQPQQPPRPHTAARPKSPKLAPETVPSAAAVATPAVAPAAAAAATTTAAAAIESNTAAAAAASTAAAANSNVTTTTTTTTAAAAATPAGAHKAATAALDKTPAASKAWADSVDDSPIPLGADLRASSLSSPIPASAASSHAARPPPAAAAVPPAPKVKPTSYAAALGYAKNEGAAAVPEDTADAASPEDGGDAKADAAPGAAAAVRTEVASIHVAGYDTTIQYREVERQLTELFSQFGPVRQVSVNHKGFSFVDFEQASSVAASLAATITFGTRTLACQERRPSSFRPAGGRGGMRGGGRGGPGRWEGRDGGWAPGGGRGGNNNANNNNNNNNSDERWEGVKGRRGGRGGGHHGGGNNHAAHNNNNNNAHAHANTNAVDDGGEWQKQERAGRGRGRAH